MSTGKEVRRFRVDVARLSDPLGTRNGASPSVTSQSAMLKVSGPQVTGASSCPSRMISFIRRAWVASSVLKSMPTNQLFAGGALGAGRGVVAVGSPRPPVVVVRIGDTPAGGSV